MAAWGEDRDLQFNVVALALEDPEPAYRRMARRALDDIRQEFETLRRTVKALVEEED